MKYVHTLKSFTHRHHRSSLLMFRQPNDLQQYRDYQNPKGPFQSETSKSSSDVIAIH
jgi:hypothetical protein